MSLYCTDKDLEQKIKNQRVYHFIGDHDQRKCFSVLMLVEVIKQVDKTLDVINLGAEDFIKRKWIGSFRRSLPIICKNGSESGKPEDGTGTNQQDHRCTKEDLG